jgi:putative protease
MTKLELLAPAKDLASGILAINCGADAVYIGAEKFSARAAAKNSLADIEQLVKHAHRYWAKVYVALNTLLTPEERAEAALTIGQLYAMGADAIIIQDLGLLEHDLPPIPLFASTQCDNRTPEKVKQLQDYGLQRAILARELTIDQIKQIRAATTIELEAFVHGSLCVCYSGQCFMSYAIGGRSANRGECAQPCRKKYSLRTKDGKMISTNKHLLSIRDLNLSKQLQELAEAGITSFKIEGRLKDQPYVKNVVGAYRKKLDTLIESGKYQKASSGNVDLGFTPDLNKTFNRDYTAYNLHGEIKDYTSFDTPKHRGEKVASIKDLHPADGITYYLPDGSLQGAYVNTKTLTGQMTVYRNYDYLFHKTLESAKVKRSIGVAIVVNDAGITFTDEDAVTVTISWPNNYESAQKPEQAIATIEKQLSKLGETEFQITNFINNLPQPWFIPVKELNDLRRQAVEQLQTLRQEKYPQQKIMRKPIKVSNIPQLETGKDFKGQPVMTTKHCLRKCFGLCGDPTELILIDEKGKEYPLEFDCQNCEMRIIF